MTPSVSAAGEASSSGVAAASVPLQHSRSYVTLTDLADREIHDASPHAAAAAVPGDNLDMQSNGQQVTLVQGNQTHVAKKESTNLSANPFLDVLGADGKTKVVSLTPPAAANSASRHGGLVYHTTTTTTNSAGAGNKKAVSQGDKRRGRKRRQAAYLSVLFLVLALFLRRDRGADFAVDKDLIALGGGAKLSSGAPWSYAGAAESAMAAARAAAGYLGLGSAQGSSFQPTYVEGDLSGLSDQSELDKWNATRFGAPMLTEWGEKMAPGDVASTERHPRPQMRRPGRWTNLNGFWDYKVEAVTHGAAFPSGEGFGGKILVPFSIESALSGVARDVGSDKQVVYRRHVRVPASGSGGDHGERHVLHFGAVDWKAWVYINGELVGSHQGGFDAFHFDITDFLKRGGREAKGAAGERVHEITVVVWDPTEDGQQPHGKQWQNKGSDRLIAPAGMWYTSVTGIWQTVWLESVPETFYVDSLRLTPSIESRTVVASVATKSAAGLMPFVKLTAYDEHGIVGFGSGWSGDEVTLKFSENHIPKLWSPSSPFLYNLTVSLHLSAKGEAVDVVESYFAMREITLGRAGEAVQFHLNGEPVFQYGVLDQGWWPDGLYTPPSEEALEFDILKAKEFGFNLIRKHAKVESSRFYHLCDKHGMLVWQDMPSSSGIYMWSPDGAHDFKEGEKTPMAASGFVSELRGVMGSLYNHPSIVSWIPFNEGWGQFDTAEIFAWMQRYDPQRLVWVSGGNDFGIGSAFDRHVYPGPSFVRLEECRASVLGEFGGNGFAIEGHTWGDGKGAESTYDTFLDWGYAEVKTLKELERYYQLQMTVLSDLVGQGLSAAIFTQLSDVESEFNGIMTYDRKVMKLDSGAMRSFHDRLYAAGREPKTGLHKEGAQVSEKPTKVCAWE